MITTSTPSSQTKETNYKIIFPKGEFWSDEPPLETYLHLTQIILLLKSLQWLWSEQLQLYLGIYEDKLRYFDIDGELVSSPEESAIKAENQAIKEKQKADRLAAKLLELEINPDEI
ncbi:MAG: hypothetical protein AB4062_12805 [Crocosphaera sp.]